MSKLLLKYLNGAPRVQARTWTAALCALLILGVASAASAAVETYEPGLSKLVAPQAAQLQAAGIKSILTRTGKHRRDIQVQTQWGPAYFPWPKNVTPALFEIYIANDGTAEVYTDENYKDSTQARYVAAFNAIIPEAVRQAQLTRAAAQKPRR